MKATFDGTERDFHINREHAGYLEHSLDRGLYAVLKDATEGNWTFADVAMVISFALHGPSKDDRMVISMARQTAKFGMPVRFGYRYRPHPDVTAVLVRDGHGNFASLMADILTELIFGDAANVEAPDAATA